MEWTVRQLGWLAVVLCALACSRAHADPAEDEYTVAAGHYAEGRWDLAVEQFQLLLKEHPEHARANHATFFLGEALVQLARFKEAEEQFQTLLSRDPQGPYSRQALFRSGEAAYLRGEVETAKRELERFLAAYPEDALNAFVLSYLGEMAMAGGDMAAAGHHFTQALRDYPDGLLRHDCQLGLAKILANQDRHDEAERMLRELAENEECPLADRAQFQLGLLYYESGKSEEALAVWNTFEGQFRESRIRPRVELGRSRALFRLERYGEAQELLGSLIQDENIGIEAQYWLGLTLRAQQQWKNAAETLAMAARADAPAELLPAIRFHAGDSLLHAANRDEAVAQFDAVLADSPDSQWADDSLFGKIQAALEGDNHGDVDRLAVEFQDRFPNSPLKSETLLLRASALVALERFAEAAKVLEDFLAGNPETPETPRARAELVFCFIRMDRIGDAKAAYQKLAEMHPEHELILPAMHQLAEAAYAAGEHQYATELFEQMSTGAAPEEYAAKGISGSAWSKLNAGDADGAAVLFEQLIKEHPHHPLAAEAALARGQIFEQQEKFDPALAMYHVVIQEYPNSQETSEALLRAARIHDRLQQDQQAATLYKRLVDDYPTFVQIDGALYGWAWVMLELSEPDQAAVHFQRLHDEFRQSKYWADATYRLAKRASEREDYDRSAHLLDELISAAPEPDILAHALYLQGRVASQRQLWEQVEQPMARLLAEVPESPLGLPAEYSIAEAVYRQNDFDRALTLFQELAGKIQGRTETWLAMVPLRLSQVMVHNAQWNAAQEVAKKIPQDFPKFERMYEVDYVLGQCLAGQARFSEARDAYQRVIRSPEGSKTETAAMAQWMIGESYFHQKNYAAARREYLRAEILYAYPKWQAGAVLQAGKCHEQLSEWKEAVELYSRILTRYSSTTFTDEAVRRLRIAEGRLSGK